MSLGNTGISPTYKVPRFIVKVINAAGAVGAGSQRLKVLAVGMKTSAGSIVPDTEPKRVTNEDEVDALAGPGSDLATQGYMLVKIPSVEAYLAAVTEPAGGTEATATLVLSGTLTSGGTLRFRLGGKPVSVSVGLTDAIDTIGANIAAAFNAKTRLPATAAYNSSTDTVTLTCKNKGAQGRDWILYWDQTDAPAGLEIAMTGSAAVNEHGVRLGAAGTGAGSPDVTTLLTRLQTKRYARIAPSHNDATNAAHWEAHINAKAGALAQLYEQVTFGHNGSLASAISLAQTTLNAFRAMVAWLRNGENSPGEIAALIAAIRSVTEQTSPVPDYDGLLLEALAPQAFDADLPSDPEQDQALNAGVSPLTSINGQVRMVRGITSYCLNGSVQDERCLDIGDSVMADYAALDLRDMYETEFRPQNPYVGPDPAPEEEPPPEGVAYPLLWTSKATARVEGYYDSRWLKSRPRGAWAIRSDYNEAGDFIQSEVPLDIRRVQHRLDAVVRQIHNQV